jgi:hypothetical protein
MFHTLAILCTVLSVPGPETPPVSPPEALECFVEVRMRDGVNEAGPGASVREVVLDQAVFPVQQGQAHYECGVRTPVVSYAFSTGKWTAATTFQNTGNKVQLKSIHRDPEGRTRVTYVCEVATVLTVLDETVIPIVGSLKWNGTASLAPGAPLVVSGRCRVDRRQFRIPPGHPLYDPKATLPERDLVKEITVTVKISRKTRKGV